MRADDDCFISDGEDIHDLFDELVLYLLVNDDEVCDDLVISLLLIVLQMSYSCFKGVFVAGVRDIVHVGANKPHNALVRLEIQNIL
jgi:hypothetical protein